MTSVLKKKSSKVKSELMQEDAFVKWEDVSREQKGEDVGKLIKFIDDNVVGKDNSFCGPYGRRKVVYCDYSGSGRALQWVEDLVSRQVLPIHATRCTALSYTSGQSEAYRSEARAILRNAVGACPEDIVVLGASLPRLVRTLRPQQVTLFVSARETERQLAPWREFDAEIVKIPETKEGFIDLNNLELRLQQKSGNGRRLIGFFPAASKLTGMLADDVATTLLLHQYGAWSFWDYTLVAPSCAVDMNPTFPGVEEQMVKKDALFLNCEKFVGGVQGPQVAVIKKEVFRDTPIYCDDNEVLSERIEEWGTVDSVRASVVMMLRDAVGLQTIAIKQDHITRQVLSHIRNIPELILLGSQSATARRLPIFSIMVKHPRGTFLHHNFVCAVLNDVFGIQARGGLNSTLSYGADILGIDDQLLKEYEKLLNVEVQREIARVRKLSDAKAPDIPIYNEHLRPGFCRISLPFFMCDAELAFVMEALKMVATEGWKILPQYTVSEQTGQWRHHSCSLLRDRKSLTSLRFQDGKITAHERRVSGPGIFPQTHTETLQTARNLFNRARKLAMKCSTAEPEVAFNPRIDYLRWFMLPKEAHDLLLGKSASVKHIVPFHPSGYTGARKSLQAITRSSISCSPTLGSSPRHFSLSSIDDCQVFRFKQKQKLFSRDCSLKEMHKEEAVAMSQPVHFAVGESVSPLRLIPSKPLLVRSRCYSLGSDGEALSTGAKINLGLKEKSPSNIVEKTGTFCNCGSQTDLQSLDDPMISPNRPFPYNASSNSISDCSQQGRMSPMSLNSQTSEDLQAYVKEMTREIATEIKSEIRDVISKVDDILENSDSIEQLNLSMNSLSSQERADRMERTQSVSVIDVAEYLMGMSKEMASEVKHEIREMVNQVDEMISPDHTAANSRKSSPPQYGRQRIGSGPDLSLNTKQEAQSLHKCPTSPVLPLHYEEDSRYCRRSPQSPGSMPSNDTSGPSSISFSSETSSPDTIIQVMTTQTTQSFPKSLSSTKLSDEELCGDSNCKQCLGKKSWCQNASISSQDSGINLNFPETDSYLDFVKWRTSSDPTTNKAKKLQGRLRMCHKHEKSEVPDIIEGVPCPTSTTQRYDTTHSVSTSRTSSIVNPSTRSSRCSMASSSSSDRSSRSSGYCSDLQRCSLDEQYYDKSESDYRLLKEAQCWEEDDSSACSDSSLTDFALDDDGKWHSPPKAVWKPTVEAIQEYNMLVAGDKALVCVSGSRQSIALLHAVRRYQLYARAKGIHFTVGALFVHENKSDVDPLHLMAYCRTLGVKLIYQDRAVDDHGDDSSSASSHRWSGRAVRRGAYLSARTHGYTVLCVAQTLDRAARAFLASALHAGELRTVKAHYRVREYDLRIVRPFILVRSRDIEEFCTSRALPGFKGERCQLEDGDKTRKSPVATTDGADSPPQCLSPPLECARALLSRHERAHPHCYNSLKTALQPLIAASRTMERGLKEHRHRKKSVIQMRDGVPVYDSDDGTDEESMP